VKDQALRIRAERREVDVHMVAARKRLSAFTVRSNPEAGPGLIVAVDCEGRTASREAKGVDYRIDQALGLLDRESGVWL